MNKKGQIHFLVFVFFFLNSGDKALQLLIIRMEKGTLVALEEPSLQHREVQFILEITKTQSAKDKV